MQMMKTLIIAALILPSAASAGEIYGKLDYLNGWRLADGSYQTAIEFDLSDGWKTYWRTPGPAGIPPSFDWGGSSNIADVEIDWPTPQVFDDYGLISIGYKDHIMLPVRITPIQPNVPINVELNFEFGVCSDICVPAAARFNTKLGNLPDEGVSEILTALENGPVSAKSAGVRSATCTLTPNSDGFNVKANLNFARTLSGDRTTVIEYADPDIWIDIAETRINGQNLTADAALEYYGDGMLTIDRSAIRITVLDKNGAVEILGCPAS